MDKINVAKLLKDCPKGMELDCTMFDGVYFDHVDDLRLNRIKCYVNNGDEHFEIAFEEDGKYISNDSAKCVIFPKGKTTWKGFVPPCQFKDGDIVISSLDNIHILKNRSTSYIYVDFTRNAKGNLCKSLTTCVNAIRLATEKEKAKLFQAIKDNGYKWNAETKTLEKLPKFKVGDKITNGKTFITIGYIDNEYYYEVGRSIATRLFIKNQDEWKLVPNKFDITTLVPFESRVLIRNDKNQYWIPAFWGCKRADGYTTTFGWCKYCIPFEGNEHLLETNKDCDEYYKTWK